MRQKLKVGTPGCGVILLGLQEGVTAEDIADVLAGIGGTVTRDRSGGSFGWVAVSVRRTEEGSALLRALLDARLRYGGLSISGLASLFIRR